MALTTTTKIGLGILVAGAIGIMVALDPGEGVLEYVYVEKVTADPGHFAGRTFKVHGTVVEGTIKAKKGTTGDYRFVIEHEGQRLAVHFTDIPPDTFQEGGEVILTGRLNSAGDTFESEEMSAKCPSKYEEEAKVAGAAKTPNKT
ncbi:MAG: cytochrome c maturation protein CcmE [Deltaproteobacteria bacterium]|nr:cytochrome c maturation protein CcmE [Deltaproteobacteria bacterium]